MLADLFKEMERLQLIVRLGIKAGVTPLCGAPLFGERNIRALAGPSTSHALIRFRRLPAAMGPLQPHCSELLYTLRNKADFSSNQCYLLPNKASERYRPAP